MSTFYGTVVGSARTEATRRGYQYIKVAAQSWDGSLITRLTYSDDDQLMVDLQMSEGSSTYGRTVFYGSLDDLKNQLAK